MQRQLVSILTPMYNTGAYVHRLLDSVLSQDYPKIEMIVVDDGSTDGSKDVVESYVGRFSARGYRLRYVYQANAGQSVAIRNGLPLVEGEYLAWPDSDDFYASADAITKMVGVLALAGEEFQLVRTQVRYVQDGTLKTLRVRGRYAHEEEDRSLFADCLLGTNAFYYCAGSYLLRTAVLKELTDFDLYTDKDAGQNWQLLLPVLYSYRCKTIMEPLFTVVERASSHSRGQYSGEDRTVRKFDAYVNTRIETLRRIKGLPEEELSRYENQVRSVNGKGLLDLAIRDNERRLALKRLPSCRADMGRLAYGFTRMLLHIPGGTYLLNSYKRVHHILFLLKRRLRYGK